MVSEAEGTAGAALNFEEPVTPISREMPHDPSSLFGPPLRENAAVAIVGMPLEAGDADRLSSGLKPGQETLEGLDNFVELIEVPPVP